MLFNFYLNNIFYSIILLINFTFSIQECIEGINYCLECMSSSQICQKCSNNSYYPDLNGGCSSTKNCLLSKDGICTKCYENYFLSNDNICTTTNFCLKANVMNSKCLICMPGYILTINGGCSFSEKCIDSDPKRGICKLCEDNYYFDLDNYECKSNLEKNKFNFCLKSLQNNCIECSPSFFLGADNRCSNSKNCKFSENGTCTECSSGYFLSLNDKICTNTQNCLRANNSKWECEECIKEFLYNNSIHKCIVRDDKN